MSWNSPQYFWLLFLIPLGFAATLGLFSHLERKIRTLGDRRLILKILPGWSAARFFFKRALFLTALFFLILALAEPKWGVREDEAIQRGIDLFLMVDLSASMLAQDIEPSRLERAKRKIMDLLKMAQADRIGLIVFAEKAILLSPLTSDYSGLQPFLDTLSPELIPAQGTDLARALRLAMKNLKNPNRSQAILVFSDGEDHSEGLEKIIEELKEKKIAVFALGIGTLEGGPIPLPEGGYKLDSNGSRVLSKLEEGALKSLAQKTGGAYVRSVFREDDLKELYQRGIKQSLSAKEIKAQKRAIQISRFQWPLGVGIFFLILQCWYRGSSPARSKASKDLV